MSIIEEAINHDSQFDTAVSGEYIDFSGERYYVIHNADKIPPFFISVISDDDHWLFISSTGGLTAGRVSQETALFPYVTVDKIHDSAVHTGSKTIIHINVGDKHSEWEPFNMEHDGFYTLNRHLYKNILGNKLCFEEINHSLQLAFRYTWESSDRYGFIRRCELENLGDKCISVEMIDGLQNILPASTPHFVQVNSSNLVDAYKWTELDEKSGLAFFTLFSAITDRAEPCESLKANTVFCLGLGKPKVLISSDQLDHFRLGGELHQENQKRGVRGAYLVNQSLQLTALTSKNWQIIANIEQTQAQVVELRRQLAYPDIVLDEITRTIDKGSDKLARIIGHGDGFQLMDEESVTVHHYANVLFNILRGGVFDDQYKVSSSDFISNIKNFNYGIYRQHIDTLEKLPSKLDYRELLVLVKNLGDPQLERLCLEYLPITFGRRHGDPSRPWNQFEIKIKDEQGNQLLSYEGNWRDIFQNWEALLWSYPEFIENVIAKFVNASTVDGYNPYRITKQGIDWEIEDPDDPWSYIGYWGDHQIIYLLKFLELSKKFHPARLSSLLYQPVYSYANVPYRIKPFDALLKNAKDTVEYDDNLAEKIQHRVTKMGADGKLLLDSSGKVYQVNLLEKLLVPLLSKLGNLVIDGGIWLNTQRPEWNDANNALVGQGLSMVTLYYLRRYIDFLQQLFASDDREVILSNEVSRWLSNTAVILRNLRPHLNEITVSKKQRYQLLVELGRASSEYRIHIYQQGNFTGKSSLSLDTVRTLLDDAIAVINHSIGTNLRNDGLYHAYNLMRLQSDAVTIDTLYPMLEGQVAVLSSGAISPQQAVSIIEALFESDVYRPDQKTFMLYPDRDLLGFLEKNCVPQKRIWVINLLKIMLQADDYSIILSDADGTFRFNAELTNVGELNAVMDKLTTVYGDAVETSRQSLQELYEDVFNHQAFTGRSGAMFGFEGLGCVYWHMVSKMLLAVQENFFAALEQGNDNAICRRLGQLYYQLRKGIGFNKTPAEYGAFPAEPYSHTPKHAGAQQPGMTGQVKEEIITRYGELGIRVSGGRTCFNPGLLRACEFISQPQNFRYLDVDDNWQIILVPIKGLAFTWCQLPIIYHLDDEAESSLTIIWKNGKQDSQPDLTLSTEQSSAIFNHNGRIRQLTLVLTTEQLFNE